jgi:hypothetical protein
MSLKELSSRMGMTVNELKDKLIKIIPCEEER